MTATGHAVIGTVIAAKIGNPALAIPLAIASHVAADLIPHWDLGVGRERKSRNRFFFEAAVDVLISFAFVYIIVTFLFPQTSLLYALIVAVSAQLLDWITAPYLFFKIKTPPIFYWSYLLQKSFDNGTSKPIGKVVQVVVLVLLLIIGKLI